MARNNKKLLLDSFLFSGASYSFQPVVETHQAVAGTEIVEAAFFGIVEPGALAPVDGAFVVEAVLVVDMVEGVDRCTVGKVVQLVL